MPNLHNRYELAEGKISQKNDQVYVKLLIAMQMQLKFELILIYNKFKAVMDNWRYFYF